MKYFDRSRALTKNSSPHVHIDVGLTSLCQQGLRFKETFSRFMKPPMSMDELLKHKYIISAEGNDVATNTIWILASGSLLVMPLPTVETWGLESQLTPYVHFLPVKKDWSDLQRQVDWAEAHPARCERIIRNANSFIDRFSNRDRETFLEFAVLYYTNVVIPELAEDERKGSGREIQNTK